MGSYSVSAVYGSHADVDRALSELLQCGFDLTFVTVSTAAAKPGRWPDYFELSEEDRRRIMRAVAVVAMSALFCGGVCCAAAGQPATVSVSSVLVGIVLSVASLGMIKSVLERMRGARAGFLARPVAVPVRGEEYLVIARGCHRQVLLARYVFERTGGESTTMHDYSCDLR